MLKHNDIAEQYFRRWLALDPAGALPDGASPKLVEPFTEARAYIGANGRLEANVEAKSANLAVVFVRSDPLAMAATAHVDGGPPVAFSAAHDAQLDVSTVTAVSVTIDDEYGNHLLVLTVPLFHQQEWHDQPPPPEPHPIDTPPRVSPLRLSLKYFIVGGVGVAGAAAFATLAAFANQDVNDVVANSSTHYYDDINGPKATRDRDLLIAYGFGALAAVGVTVGIVVYVNASGDHYAVVPTATADRAGFALTGRW